MLISTASALASADEAAPFDALRRGPMVQFNEDIRVVDWRVGTPTGRIECRFADFAIRWSRAVAVATRKTEDGKTIRRPTMNERASERETERQMMMGG